MYLYFFDKFWKLLFVYVNFESESRVVNFESESCEESREESRE